MPHRPVRSRPVHTVTTASTSPVDDSDIRLKRYLITMAIRTACFILAVWTVRGLHWQWGWLFVQGAVVLPYIAVIGANAHEPRQMGEVPRFDPDHRGPEQLGR